MNTNKILKMIAILAALLVIVGSLSKLVGGDSMSLSEYASLNATASPSGSPAPESTASAAPGTASPPPAASSLTGASLNGISQLSDRVTYTEGFYYEPVSDSLRRYMTGVSYPALPQSPAPADAEEDADADFAVLRYVHIWHYDFSGKPVEGELICNEYIARDLVEIFYDLYRNEYQLEKVVLVDEYDGDMEAARADNNSFCFCAANARDDGLPKHAVGLDSHASGLGLDINPLYNPEISYGTGGSLLVSPDAAADYADRAAAFPYKIDESDLCYKLFIKHGFIWSGSRNSSKAYQHFQKAAPQTLPHADTR